MVGTIISVSDLNVKIILDRPSEVAIGDILTANYHDTTFKFEVVEVTGNIAKTIPFENVMYLKKGAEKLEIEKSDFRKKIRDLAILDKQKESLFEFHKKT